MKPMSVIFSTSLSVASQGREPAVALLPPSAAGRPVQVDRVASHPVGGLHDLDALDQVVLAGGVVVVLLEDHEPSLLSSVNSVLYGQERPS